MTYLGLIFGRAASGFIGDSAVYLGALILLVIGLKMIRDEGKHTHSEQDLTEIRGWALVLLPLTVSIDALSVGFGLGTFGFAPLMVALLFGIVSIVLTLMGLYLGGFFGSFIERTGLLGGIILMLLALRMAIGF